MADQPVNEEEAGEEATGVPERPLPEHPVLAGLFKLFDDVAWQRSGDQDTAVVPKDQVPDFALAARRAGFEMLVDVTAVDYLRVRRVRFEVVVGLLSLAHNIRLRLRVPVPADDPTVPSLVAVYPGANFFERETFDMFGIIFDDHPDLTRILMPDDWVGHPLRKDFATGAVPVQFKSSPQVT
ncbi:MAG: NADH-quinone oxidoreductase subunit C [Acidimicrobiia bacterium]|nr:NADH-quinone oxidoreductase subunit C [Acidimicrobiia bacterium]MDH5615816.1 NADH-quinone oxidoreductase subunit C [Acidimicrobiia bacterium]